MLLNPRRASPWTLLSFDIRLPLLAVAELSNISMPGFDYEHEQEHEYEVLTHLRIMIRQFVA